MMVPMANDEHQDLVMGIAAALYATIAVPQLGQVRPGVNLSEPGKDWMQDYRVPDVAVFLNSGSAENCDTHWCGAADLLVEITSPNDKTYEKIPFYSRLGVRELLIVDRQTWMLELYRYQQGQLTKVGQSNSPDAGADSGTGVSPVEVLTSESVPLTFRLVAGDPRPQIEIVQIDGGRSWVV